MGSRILFCALLAAVMTTAAHSNSEGDVLYAWKKVLIDPYKVLESWDPTLVNPCTWFHITCNLHNTVVRVDLANAGLLGPLIPELGQLANLEYLEIGDNKMSGMIPAALGNLTKLIGLGLHNNRFTGPIPSSFSNLRSLRFVRLNSNQLSGIPPKEFITELVSTGELILLNVSDNYFSGTVRARNATEFITTTIVQDPKASPK